MLRQAPSSADRLERLTSARGLAALYVVLFHCENTIPGFHMGNLHHVAMKGYLAVDFFFVLSGFILAYVYGAEFDDGRYRYGRFLLLRLGRIYPVHLVTLLLAATIVLLPGFQQDRWLDNDPVTFVSNLFLTHSWGLHDNLSWNFVSWSISAEWFAYMAFPAFLGASHFFARRPLVASGAAFAAVLALGSVIALTMSPGIEIGSLRLSLRVQESAPFSLGANFGILRVAFEFLAGVLLYRAYAQLSRREHRWAGPAAVVTLVVLLSVLYMNWVDARIAQDTIAVMLTAVLVLFLALDSHLLGWLLERRGVVFVGEASYSIYMVHGLVFLGYLAARDAQWIQPTLDRPAAALIAAVLLAVSIAGGIAFYQLIESPARRATRRWTDRVCGSPATAV